MLSLCTRSLSNKIGVGEPEGISSLHPMAHTVTLAILIKPDYFIVFVNMYSASI